MKRSDVEWFVSVSRMDMEWIRWTRQTGCSKPNKLQPKLHHKQTDVFSMQRIIAEKKMKMKKKRETTRNRICKRRK